jgi:hypothetical protein
MSKHARCSAQWARLYISLQGILQPGHCTPAAMKLSSVFSRFLDDRSGRGWMLAAVAGCG